MAFDWQAGLGEGLSRVGPALQMILMLQQAKQEREERRTERGEERAFTGSQNEATRALQRQLAEMEEARARRREFTDPLARQGIVVDPSAYGRAARIPAPSLGGAGPDPMQNIQDIAGQLGQGAGQAGQRVSELGMRAAAAAQTAGGRGPGAVEPFEGGFAFSQAPYPSRSESTSTSYQGVVPEQLQLKEANIYSDAMGRQLNTMYRYGASDEEVARAADMFDKVVWPRLRARIFGTQGVLKGGVTGGGMSTRTTGPVPPGTEPPPQTPDDLNTAFDRALGGLRQSYGRTVRQ